MQRVSEVTEATVRATAVKRTADDKRAVILASALRLFGQYGFRRTSIDDIAREAGIAKGTVYLYVETKEALFRALSQSLVEQMLAAARQAAAGEGTLAERLLAVLDAKYAFFYDLLLGSPHVSELLDSKGRICADLFTEADAAYARIVTKVIADATRRGEIAPKRLGLPAAEVAELLMGGAHGIAVPEVPDGVVLRKKLAALVRVVVAGLTA
jgi:AcrR family transcriptional regulator